MFVPMTANRLMLVALCLLPAAGVSGRDAGAPLVASFFYSCDASNPDPRLRTHWTAAGKPRARPASAYVEVFDAGMQPTRRYRVVGTVDVLASGSRTSIGELKTWASRGARKLGGDAIIDVTCVDAGSTQPKAGDVGLLYLTASVVNWEPTQ